MAGAISQRFDAVLGGAQPSGDPSPSGDEDVASVGGVIGDRRRLTDEGQLKLLQQQVVDPDRDTESEGADAELHGEIKRLQGAIARRGERTERRTSLMDRFDAALEKGAAVAPAQKPDQDLDVRDLQARAADRASDPFGGQSNMPGDLVEGFEHRRADWGEMFANVPALLARSTENYIANRRRMNAEETREQQLEAGAEQNDQVGYEKSAQFRALQRRADERRKRTLSDAQAVGDQMKEWADNTKLELARITPEDMDTLQQGVWSLIQSSPPQLVGLLTGILTGNPLIGGAIAGAGGYEMQAAQTYGEARDKGASHRSAGMSAGIQGAIELFDFLPISVALKPGSPFVKRLLATAATEGVTEAAQQFLQDAQSMASYDPDMTLGEMAHNMAVAGIAGSLGGAVFGTIGHLAQGKPEERPVLSEDQVRSIREQVRAIVDSSSVMQPLQGSKKPSAGPEEASFAPTHRLDDGTEVTPHTEDGEPVAGVWRDRSGALYEAERGEPIQQQEPNATFTAGGVEYPVTVVGEGARKGSVRLADGQEVSIAKLDLEDGAKEILGLLPPEEQAVKKAPAKAEPADKPEPKAPKQEATPEPAAAPKEGPAAPVRGEAELPPPRGSRRVEPEAAGPPATEKDVIEQNLARVLKDDFTAEVDRALAVPGKAAYVHLAFDDQGRIAAVGQLEAMPEDVRRRIQRKELARATLRVDHANTKVLGINFYNISPSEQKARLEKSLVGERLKPREITEKELANRERMRKKWKKEAKERKAIDVDRDSLIPAIIKLGGINAADRVDTVGDDKAQRGIPGVGYLFGKNGTGLDDMATMLVAHGYMTQPEIDDPKDTGGTRLLAERIREELNGMREHYSVARSADAMAAAEREKEQPPEEELQPEDLEAIAGEAPLALDIAPSELVDVGAEPTAESLVISDLLSQLSEDEAERLIMQYADAPESEFIDALKARVQEKPRGPAKDQEAADRRQSGEGKAAQRRARYDVEKRPALRRAGATVEDEERVREEERPEAGHRLEEPKPLFIPLNGEHFDAFERGEKTTEYRKYGGTWTEKNVYPGRHVTLSRGYGKYKRLEGVVLEAKRGAPPADPAWKAIYGDAQDAFHIKIKLDKFAARTRDEVIADIDKLTKMGERRLAGAKDESIKALRPTAAEWLDAEEFERLQRLQAELAPLEREHNAGASERVKAKRAARAEAAWTSLYYARKEDNGKWRIRSQKNTNAISPAFDSEGEAERWAAAFHAENQTARRLELEPAPAGDKAIPKVGPEEQAAALRDRDTAVLTAPAGTAPPAELKPQPTGQPALFGADEMPLAPAKPKGTKGDGNPDQGSLFQQRARYLVQGEWTGEPTSGVPWWKINPKSRGEVVLATGHIGAREVVRITRPDAKHVALEIEGWKWADGSTVRTIVGSSQMQRAQIIAEQILRPAPAVTTTTLAMESPGRRRFIGQAIGLAISSIVPEAAAEPATVPVKDGPAGPVAQWLAEHGTTALYRELARRYAPLVKDIPVKVINPGTIYLEEFPGVLRYSRGATTMSASGNRIRVYLRSDRGLNENTILHELTHAVTMRTIKFDRENPAVKRLDELYQHVKVVTAAHPDRAGFRAALENLDEFVAWGMTDSEFQSVLRTIKLQQGKTPWRSFVDVIGRVLGIGDAQAGLKSALEGVMDAGLQLIEVAGGPPTFGAVEGEPSVATQVDEAAKDANGHTASEAQKEAGNYQVGHVQLGPKGATMEGSLENEAGTSRRPEWPPLVDHYGYFKGTTGFDKDHLDFFIARSTPANLLDISGKPRWVYVVNQTKGENGAGPFDEHKVILGIPPLDGQLGMAREMYLRNYEPGWSRYSSVTPITWDGFRRWATDQSRRGPKGGELTLSAASKFDEEARNAVPEGRGSDQHEGQAAAQRDLFAAPPIPGTPARAWSTFEVAVEEQRRVKLPKGKISSAVEAAYAFRELNRWPRERFQMIGVDARGKPIAFYDLFAGTITQTSVYPREVWTVAYDTPGVKGLWFAHNHPSGLASPSQSDELLTNNLRELLKPEHGIRYLGHVIIAGEQAYSMEDYSRFRIPTHEPKALTSVPVLERVMKRADKPGAYLTSPDAAREYIRQAGLQESGLILLDAQHRAIGWWPMNVGDLSLVEVGAGVAPILRMIGRTNVAAATLYMPEGKPEFSAATLQLRHLLGLAEVKLLDAFVPERSHDATRLVSFAQRGLLEPSGEYNTDEPGSFQLAYEIPQRSPGMHPNAVASEIKADPIAKALGSKLRIVRRAVDLPERHVNKLIELGALRLVKGFVNAEEGVVHLVAENLRAGEAATTLLHEAVGHVGIYNVLPGEAGKDFREAMVDIYKSRAGVIRTEINAGFLKSYGFDLRNRTHQMQAAAEYVAHMAERGEEQTLWQQLVAAVRAALRKAGFVREWTENDIRRLLRLSRSSLENAGEDRYNGLPAWQLGERGPVWYSALERTVEKLNVTKAPARAWQGMLRNLGGIKAAELEWSGVNEWLDAQEGQVKREDLLAYLRDNGVKLSETLLGGVETGDTEMRRLLAERDQLVVELSAIGFDVEYSQEGVLEQIVSRDDGQSYYLNPQRAEDAYNMMPGEALGLRNIPRGLRRQATQFATRLAEIAPFTAQFGNADIGGNTRYSQYKLPGGQDYRELLITLPVSDTATRPRIYDGVGGTVPGPRADFQSGHFDQPNILAHVRFDTRTDAEGKRVLFIEEIQSDWGEQGRRRGFKAPDEEQTRLALSTQYAKLNALYQERWPAASRALEKNDLLGFDHKADAARALRDHLDWEQRWQVDDPADREALQAWIDEARAMRQIQQRMETPKGVDRAPFVEKTEQWVALSLKRVLRYAVDHGFDRVAWTTGGQQNDRYSLEKHIERLVVMRSEVKDRYVVKAWKPSEVMASVERSASAEELPELIGRELAERAIADLKDKQGVEYGSLDLRIGGEAMREFYDKIVPNIANNVLKNIGGGRVVKVDVHFHENVGKREDDGGTVQRTKFKELPTEQHGFDITPAMRESAGGGLPMFQLREQKGLNEVYGVRDGRLLGLASRPYGRGAWNVYLATGTNETLFARGQFTRGQAATIDEVRRMFNVAGLELVVRKPRNIPVPDRAIFDTDWVAPQADNWLKRTIIHFQNRLLLPELYEKSIAGQVGEIPEAAKAHREARIAHPRAAGKIADFDHDYSEPIVELMQRHRISIKDAGLYLYARHALERNAAIEEINPENRSGSGMSNERAGEVMTELTEKYGERFEHIERIGQLADRINHFREEVLIDKGLASKVAVTLLREKYQHYVPLKELPDDDYARGETGAGFKVGRLLNPAFGRFTEAQAEFILPGLVAQAKGTIAAGENAEVLRAFLRLVEYAPNPEVWSIKREIFRPKLDRDTGMVVWAPRRPDNRNIISVPVDGERVTVEVSDRMLANAFNTSGAQLPETLSWLGAITRFYASMATAANPEFVMTNLMRDVQEAMIRVGGTQGAALAAKTAKHMPAAFWGAFSGLRAKGQYVAGESAKPFAEEWHGWYRRYIEAGGHIAYRGIQDAESQHKDFMARLAEMGIYPEQATKVEAISARARRAARLSGAQYATQLVADINGAVENATRLAVFKNAVEFGLGDKEAAMIARNATVDFNLKGEASGIYNSLFMFFNANVQGSALLLRSVAGSRGVRTASLALLAMGLFLDWWNRHAADKDETGRSHYDNISEDIKQRNLVIMGPDRKNAILIPLPFGFGIFHNIGRHMMSAFPKEHGGAGESVVDAARNVFVAAINAFSPFGNVPQSWLGSVQLISPTFLDPIVQRMTNRNWMDKPIFPERRFGKPQSAAETYYPGTPEHYVIAADWLNRATGGNEVRPGWADMYPNVMQHWVNSVFGSAGATYSRIFAWAIGKAASDKEIETREIPFLRRFYHEPKDFELGHRFYDYVNRAEVAHYELQSAVNGGQADKAAAMRENFRAEQESFGASQLAERQVAQHSRNINQIRRDKRFDQEQKKALIEKENDARRQIMQRFTVQFEQRLQQQQ